MRKGSRICIVLAAMVTSLLTLSSCAGYEYSQGSGPMYGLPNCASLHMRNATWYYNDAYGNRVDVVGRCSKGMMHGNFEYSVNGVLAAKTKFVRDQELKTACFVGRKHRSMLYACMNEATAQTANYQRQATPVQQGRPVMVPVQPGQTVMVPVQPGQAVMVPVQPGQTVIVPAQQPQYVPAQQQQSVPAQQPQPAPQNQPTP